MERQEYLNFTRGTALQTLYEEGIACKEEGKDVSPLIEWVVQEQYNLRKNQISQWTVTVSDRCYYRYLEIMRTKLLEDDGRDDLEQALGEIKALTRTKIYALFLTQEISCWPSLESVFAAAEQDPDYETALVYTPFFHPNFEEQLDYYDEYRSMGVPVIRHNEYDLPGQSPDVVFMIKPYGNVPEQYVFKNLEKVVPRAVYIPYGMEITTDLIKYGFQYYLHYKAWRHCAYGEIVKEYGKKYGYRNGENIAVWGHPKADHYQNIDAKREQIPDEWKKIIGSRKTILWTPHHLVSLSEPGTGTWLLWGEKILDLITNSPDIVFIIRPHPLMMGALVNSGAMSKLQVNKLQQRLRETKNIIWDTDSLYYNAFYAADAIITDGTTFCVEFLYTKKPILLTPRNMQGFYLYREMQDSYYIVHDIQDVANYIQMIRDGEDPLCEKRLQLYQKMFFIPKNGTVGENIMKQVKRDMERECSAKNCVEPALHQEKEEEQQAGKQFPLFSILILCYMNTELLFDMLDSVFMQDYPRIQLIISDDGSKDFDVEYVQAYINIHKRHNIEQVIVRQNEVNLRTVRHIQKALALAEGDYVVFTAADDRFFGTSVISGYVEQFLKKPESVWLVARCKIMTADYKRVIYNTPTEADAPYFEEADARKLFSRWSRRGMAIPCCMAFRKDAFDLVGGIDLDYQFLEDWPLVLKLLRNGYAPIYYSEITAIHSTGGITNSNDRYGKELRKLFYDDKYTIFHKEVDPYIKLLFPEDRKAYKQYLREIMARNYFFDVDWPGTSILEKMLLLIKRPSRIFWLLEKGYMQYKGLFQRKKMFLASQALLLFALLFLGVDRGGAVGTVFRCMGGLDLLTGLILLVMSLVTYPLEKYYGYKAALRKRLVN